VFDSPIPPPRDTAQAMSQEYVEVPGVRTKVVVSTKASRRTLEDRVVMRFPRLVRAIGSAYLRLPPSLRGGLIVRQEDFADRDAALEAAGLSE
jgi:hypothetical protein